MARRHPPLQGGGEYSPNSFREQNAIVEAGSPVDLLEVTTDGVQRPTNFERDLLSRQAVGNQHHDAMPKRVRPDHGSEQPTRAVEVFAFGVHGFTCLAMPR